MMIHLLLTQAIILYLFVCTVWGAITAIRRRPVSPSYRGTLLIAEGLYVVQAVVGASLLIGGNAPRDPLHYLYGFLGVAILPAILGYLERGKHRESLWLALTSLFLLGVAIRAWMTGAG